MRKNKIMIGIMLCLFIALGSMVSAWYASCTDSDGGKNYNTKGVVTYYGTKYTDYCSVYGKVAEYYCTSWGKSLTFYQCQNGCIDGKCNVPYICGNGIKEGYEQCDNGVNNGALCVPSYNGQCNYCTASCHLDIVYGGRCGDSVLNTPQEQCDDGNYNTGDGCTPDCKIETCTENWQCTEFGECQNPDREDYWNVRKYRACTDLNNCGTYYNKPATSQVCSCYNTWVIEEEMINIGDLTSEDTHNLQNWGDIEPMTHGGSWGEHPTHSSCCAYGSIQAYDGNCRVVSTTTTTDEATLEVPIGWGNFYIAQQIEFTALKGFSGNDSFEVYVDGIKMYEFIDNGLRNEFCNGEDWVKHSFAITEIGTPLDWIGANLPNKENKALIELKFISMASHWSSYDTFGQVAISEIKARWKRNINVCS